MSRVTTIPHHVWALHPALSPWSRRKLKNWGQPSSFRGGEGVKCPKMVIGLETLAHEERLKGWGSFSLVKRGLRGIPFLPSRVRYREMIRVLSSQGFTVMDG